MPTSWSSTPSASATSVAPWFIVTARSHGALDGAGVPAAGDLDREPGDVGGRGARRRLGSAGAAGGQQGERQGCRDREGGQGGRGPVRPHGSPRGSRPCSTEVPWPVSGYARGAAHPHDLVALEGLDPREPVRPGPPAPPAGRCRTSTTSVRDAPPRATRSSCGDVAGPVEVAAARARRAGESATSRPRSRRAAWRASGSTSSGRSRSAGTADDGVDQGRQRGGDVVEALGGERRAAPASVVGGGAEARCRAPARPRAARHPGGQRVDVADDARRCAACRPRGSTATSQASTSRGVRRAGGQDPVARRGQASAPGPAAWRARPPARRPRRRPGPAAMAASDLRRATPPRRRPGRAACPSRARAAAPRPGRPPRAAGARGAAAATGRASARRWCRPPTGPAPAAGRRGTGTTW